MQFLTQRLSARATSLACLSLLALAPLGLLGCGGGGTPGDDATPTPRPTATPDPNATPAPLTTLGEAYIGTEISGLTPDASYYPLGTGDTWIWEDHDNGNIDTYGEKVIGPTTFEGNACIQIDAVTSTNRMYVKVDSVGLYSFGSRSGDTIYVTSPSLILRWNLVVGAMETFTMTESEKGSSSLVFQGRYINKVTRKPDRRIVLASGAFDCVVYENQRLTYNSESEGAIPEITNTTVYYASGAGMVYSHTRFENMTGYTVLKYASVGGKTYGTRARLEPKSDSTVASRVGKSFRRL